jgi:hypothetical protein
MQAHLFYKTVIVSLGVILLATLPSPAEEEGQRNSENQSRAVIVELFTAEGCSSCPPADALLNELARTPAVAGAEVIALGEHVDYWNSLGWRDRFSDAAFSARQAEYSRLHGAEPYTPQMVVDGQLGFVGNDAGQARGAIAQAAQNPKAQVRVLPLDRDTSDSGRRIAWRIEAERIPEQTARRVAVYLAVTEDGLSSDVKRGENRGLVLQHAAVVRSLKQVGEIDTRKSDRFVLESFTNLKPEWHREQLRLVAFLQEKASRKIVGAAVTAAKAE